MLGAEPRWSSRAAARLALRQQLERELALCPTTPLAPAPAPASTGTPAPANGEVRPTSANDRWFMQELLQGMRAFDNYYLLSYDVDGGQPLSQALLPAHRRMLQAAAQDAFRTASDADWQRLLTIVHPDVLSLLPSSMLAPRSPAVSANAASASSAPGSAQRTGLADDDRLSINEFLALVDYLHPHTCHYLVINAGLRLSRFWGVEGIAQASALLREPYLSALHKLSRSGLFTDGSGLYAKGVVARGHAGRLSETLNFLASRGGRVLPPHPLSATRWQQQSFALQPGRPEDTTILLKVPQAIDVTPFHGSLGKSLGEVILLPQPLRLTDAGAAPRPPGAAAHVPVYWLEALEPVLSQRQARGVVSNIEQIM